MGAAGSYAVPSILKPRAARFANRTSDVELFPKTTWIDPARVQGHVRPAVSVDVAHSGDPVAGEVLGRAADLEPRPSPAAAVLDRRFRLRPTAFRTPRTLLPGRPAVSPGAPTITSASLSRFTSPAPATDQPA